MMLAVGEALTRTGPPYTAGRLTPALVDAFVAWMRAPDNDRAPGTTCMAACRKLAAGRSWEEATVAGSKGCGANMRVQPVGLLPVTEDVRAGLAQLQAALTHGHPTAIAAADLTAFALAELAAQCPPAQLVVRLHDYVRRQRDLYWSDWLGDLGGRSGETRAAFIARGWDECGNVLDRLEVALARADRATDPCRLTGAGWIAEEALATGLLCFLLFPEEPVAAIRHATRTSGDSDSIACLTGAFAGAACGATAWPSDWFARIEYADRLGALADDLWSAHVYADPALEGRSFVFAKMAGPLWAGRNPLTASDVRRIARAGITHVLDLREEREWCAPGRYGAEAIAALSEHGIARCHLAVADASAPDRSVFDRAWDFVRVAITCPENRVFLHCRAGRERTAAIAGALWARFRGVPFEQALAELQRGKPDLNPLRVQRRAAEAWLRDSR